MGIKYIRNTDDATIGCKSTSNKKKEFIFRPKKFDKRNNILLSNGYTQIEEEDIALLREESNVFRYYEKLGRLTVVDSLPQEAMSSEQLVASLKAEIASLKAALKGNPQTDDSSKKTIEKQKKEIDALKEENERLQMLNDELSVQLAEETEVEKEVE